MPSPTATPEAFPILVCAGTASEVGRTHGEHFAAQVHASVEVYRDKLGAGDQMWPLVVDACRAARERISAYDRKLAEELAGIATGADIDPDMVMLLTIRSDLVRRRDHLASLAAGSAGQHPTATTGAIGASDDECTTAVALAASTVDGHTLMAQNWDKVAGTKATTVVIDLHVEDDPRLVTVTEAGVLMHHGFTDRGLGILGNSLTSDRDFGPMGGIPTGVARRRAMRHDTLAAAADTLRSVRRDLAGNHLLASLHEQAAVDLELVPGDEFDVEPESGVLVHTNHFTSPKACRTINDLNVHKSRSTTVRFDSARDHLITAAAHNQVSRDTMMAMMRDHTGEPDNVCKHEPLDTDAATVTVSSTLIDLDEATLWVTPGPP